MRRIVMPLLLLSLVGACSQISSSRLNPTDWLRAQEGPPSLIPEENMILGITEREYAGTPIYQIADLILGPHIGRENFDCDRLCHPRRSRECRV